MKRPLCIYALLYAESDNLETSRLETVPALRTVLALKAVIACLNPV